MWNRLTESHLQGVDDCDPLYRPTNFWSPGVRRLLGDLNDRGLEVFKSWPTAHSWFYPIYGSGFSNATIGATHEFALTVNPSARKGFVTAALNGSLEARRDFDAARLFWDQQRWPFDLTGFGESKEGKPPQRYRLTGVDEVGFGRPYLNYFYVWPPYPPTWRRRPAVSSRLAAGSGFSARSSCSEIPTLGMSTWTSLHCRPVVVLPHDSFRPRQRAHFPRRSRERTGHLVRDWMPAKLAHRGCLRRL